VLRPDDTFDAGGGVAVFDEPEIEDEGLVDAAGAELEFVAALETLEERVWGAEDDDVAVLENCSGLIAAKVSSVGSSQFVVPLG
jgi:hypothetical protein